MELRVLQYFLTVAREENITRAAKLLHITQPTLSRQLMQLEEELGVKLFTRSSHNVVLTEEGLLLQRRAREILALAEQTRRDFAHDEGQLAGRIGIGSGELHSTQFLSELIAGFHQLHPLVQYELYSGNADNIKERIEQGLLDIGLLVEPVDIGRYELLRIPVQEEYGALVPECSPLATQGSLSPADLAGLPLVVANRELVQGRLAEWLGTPTDRLNIVATGNLQYNNAMLARAGMGITIGLRLAATYEGLCFLPFTPALTSGSVLVWKKAQALSPSVSAFLGYARQYLSGISMDKI